MTEPSKPKRWLSRIKQKLSGGKGAAQSSPHAGTTPSKRTQSMPTNSEVLARLQPDKYHYDPTVQPGPPTADSSATLDQAAPVGDASQEPTRKETGVNPTKSSAAKASDLVAPAKESERPRQCAMCLGYLDYRPGGEMCQCRG